MKAVFSFWSKPFSRSLHKSYAGFPNKEYFATAFRLALLTAKKNFKTTELVTDTEGYKLLVEDLGLAFDTVSLALNDISDIPANLWAFGKMHAYSIQTAPFVHLDFDLFLLQPVPQWFKSAKVITQSTEPFATYDFYRWSTQWIAATHRKLPVEFQAVQSIPFAMQLAYNTGIIGGENWQPLADYGKKACQMMRDNLDIISTLPDFRVSEANVAYEQYFLWAYCKYHKIPVTCYINNVGDNEETKKKGFTHLLASSKGDIANCEAFTESYRKFLNRTSAFYYE